MRRVLLSLALVFGAPSMALAAGGGDHPPSWAVLGFSAVNFSIFAFIIYKFAWPLLTEYLRDRHAQVVKALEAAKHAKLEAERLKAEFEQRMKGLASEAEKAREEILNIARTEAARMLDQAEKAAAQIRKDAELVAEQEVARARRELQEESARIVAKAAAELIQGHVTAEDQDRFVTDFVSEAREDPQ